jgi:hypothetical protein
MYFKNWLQSVIKSGNLCDVYKDNALDAKSKVALMKLCLDANGCSYLCEMQAKGYPLSYETIKKEFKAYINGRYVYENKYTSTLFCQYKGEIECDTTALTLVECDVDVFIPEYHICEIYATCKTNIHLHGNGRVVVIAYGNADDVVMFGGKLICRECVEKIKNA